jgi:hypothetical protein
MSLASRCNHHFSKFLNLFLFDFLMFLKCFDVLISKIISKIKKYYFIILIYFQEKNILKSSHHNTPKYPLKK